MKKIGHYEYYFIFEKNNYKMELGRSVMGYLDKKMESLLKNFMITLKNFQKILKIRELFQMATFQKNSFRRKIRKKLLYCQIQQSMFLIKEILKI